MYDVYNTFSNLQQIKFVKSNGIHNLIVIDEFYRKTFMKLTLALKNYVLDIDFYGKNRVAGNFSFFHRFTQRKIILIDFDEKLRGFFSENNAKYYLMKTSIAL